jgi:4-hydroxy-tetrahydrodipicolinate synthase
VNWTFRSFPGSLGCMLTGLFVPLITPFTASGAVALDALASLAADVLDGGATGLVALGTTGEPFALSAEERRSVIDVCDRVCRERSAPLIVGAGSNDTAATLASLRDLATRPSIVAALVAVPYYTVPTVEGVLAHFALVASASPVPVVVYNVPYRTGLRLPSSALLRLATTPGITGVKHAVGSVDADTCELLASAPPSFAVLAGDDALAPPLLALGAAGAITASAHVSTKEYAAMVEAWRTGSVELGQSLGRSLGALSMALFAEPNPTVIKGVLHAQGRIPSPAVRLPLLPARETAVQAALACVP